MTGTCNLLLACLNLLSIFFFFLDSQNLFSEVFHQILLNITLNLTLHQKVLLSVHLTSHMLTPF